MVDYRTRATRETIDQIRGELGSLVFAIEIRINTRLAEAPRAGQTIFQFDPAATGAAAAAPAAEKPPLPAVPEPPPSTATPPAPSVPPASPPAAAPGQPPLRR